MPLDEYGVLVGKARAARREDTADTPHYQVHVRAGAASFRIAVNVKSVESPSELLFLVDEDFRHPVLASLTALGEGFTPLASKPGGSALDFIRANLFDRQDMRTLPASLPGPDNDLSDRIEHYVRRAIEEADARVFAFGQRWGPENKPDKIFTFEPGNGIHDIHMNQGNSAAFRKDDGVWQDGALLLSFPSTGQWVGVFLAFQSQAWHTDDVTGHAITAGPETEKTVRIIAAMVNPEGGEPEEEWVALLNPTPRDIDLTGWTIADRAKARCPLSGTIAAGSVLRARVSPPAKLGNSGGIATLLDASGLKVDGVSYTKEQARREGWLVVF